eukprot:666392-Rhodomonas_salina.1
MRSSISSSLVPIFSDFVSSSMLPFPIDSNHFLKASKNFFSFAVSVVRVLSLTLLSESTVVSGLALSSSHSALRYATADILTSDLANRAVGGLPRTRQKYSSKHDPRMPGGHMLSSNAPEVCSCTASVYSEMIESRLRDGRRAACEQVEARRIAAKSCEKAEAALVTESLRSSVSVGVVESSMGCVCTPVPLISRTCSSMAFSTAVFCRSMASAGILFSSNARSNSSGRPIG